MSGVAPGRADDFDFRERLEELQEELERLNGEAAIASITHCAERRGASGVKVKLGDHVDLRTGFPFKSAFYTRNIHDILLLRGDNIGQGFLRWDGAMRWPHSDLDRFTQFELQA